MQSAVVDGEEGDEEFDVAFEDAREEQEAELSPLVEGVLDEVQEVLDLNKPTESEESRDESRSFAFRGWLV